MLKRKMFLSRRRFFSTINHIERQLAAIGVKSPTELIYIMENALALDPNAGSTSIFNTYTELALNSINSFKMDELSGLMRVVSRADLNKPTLMKVVSDRIIREQSNLSPSDIAYFVSSFSRINGLTIPLTVNLGLAATENASRMSFSEISRILIGFGKVGYQSEQMIDALTSRAATLLTSSSCPTPKTIDSDEFSVRNSLFLFNALVSLGSYACSANKLAETLLLDRIIPAMSMLDSRKEAPLLAFSLVSLPVDAPMNLRVSSVKSLVAALNATAIAVNVKCVSDLSLVLNESAVRQISTVDVAIRHQEFISWADLIGFMKARPDICSPAAKLLSLSQIASLRAQPKTSALAVKVRRSLEYLGVSNFKVEVPAGPYLLDFAWEKERVAIEVDGFYHFDPASRIEKSKSSLKQRLLKKMGWKVISLPFYELAHLGSQERRGNYLKAKFEEAKVLNWNRLGHSKSDALHSAGQVHYHADGSVCDHHHHHHHHDGDDEWHHVCNDPSHHHQFREDELKMDSLKSNEINFLEDKPTTNEKQHKAQNHHHLNDNHNLHDHSNCNHKSSHHHTCTNGTNKQSDINVYPRFRLQKVKSLSLWESSKETEKNNYTKK